MWLKFRLTKAGNSAWRYGKPEKTSVPEIAEGAALVEDAAHAAEENEALVEEITPTAEAISETAPAAEGNEALAE